MLSGVQLFSKVCVGEMKLEVSSVYMWNDCKYFIDSSTTKLNTFAWANEFRLQRFPKGRSTWTQHNYVFALQRQTVRQASQISAPLSSLAHCSQEEIFWQPDGSHVPSISVINLVRYVCLFLPEP